MIEDAKIPIIITRKENANAENKNFDQRIIVRLSGGPGGIPIGSASDFVIPLSKNDILIDFLYTGSGTNLIYPAPNFGTAVSQVRSFIIDIRRRNPKAQIVLFGESLGAVIAAASIDKSAIKDKSPVVDQVVLLSPVTISMQEFIDFWEDLSPTTEAENLFSIYRVLESEKDDWSTRKIVRMNRIEVLKNFFEVQELDNSLKQRTDNIFHTTDILLLYGENDPLVAAKDIEKMMGSPVVEIEKIDRMHHSFSTPGHVEHTRYAIEVFLESRFGR